MFKKKKIERDAVLEMEFRFYPDQTAMLKLQTQAVNEWAELLGELMAYAYLARHVALIAGANKVLKDIMLDGIGLGSQFRLELEKRSRQFRTLVDFEKSAPQRVLKYSFWFSSEQGKWNGGWKPWFTFSDNASVESVFLLQEYLAGKRSGDEEYIAYLDKVCLEVVELWRANELRSFNLAGNMVLTVCEPYIKRLLNANWKAKGMSDEQIDGIWESIDLASSAEKILGSKFSAKDWLYILTGKGG
jgi:hypothetical protein